MNPRSTRLAFVATVAVTLIFGSLAVVFLGSASDRVASSRKSTIARPASQPPTSRPEDLAQIRRDLDNVKGELKSNKKDSWDHLSAVAPLISGLAIATIGGWATFTVSKNQRLSEATRADRELTVHRSSTIPPLIPYLGSENEQEKKTALLAIDALGDPDLAAKLAEIYGGEGSASALSQIAARSPRDVAVVAEKSLDTLFHSLKPSIVRLIVDDRPAASGFFVAPGRVLTTGYALHPEARTVLQLHTGELLDTTLRAWDNDTDLALLETAREDFPVLKIQPLGDSDEDVREIFAGEVTAIGYTGTSFEPEVRVGPVEAVGVQLPDFPGVQMIQTRFHAAGGLSGAPAVNPRGHVIGVVRLYSESGYSFLIPANSLLGFLRQQEVLVNLPDAELDGS
ncbi:hypothetical protein OK006_8973 [Actinobacteria bacterium OK006]|nr:hypothetical protein OK006_8973 [Actinobacteria bacterium OK006]